MGAGEGESELRFLFLTVNAHYNGFPLVSLRVPILRSEFFEEGLKVLPKLSFNYILIISSVNNNVKSFLHFF